jgi:hypothetical protein
MQRRSFLAALAGGVGSALLGGRFVTASAVNLSPGDSVDVNGTNLATTPTPTGVHIVSGAAAPPPAGSWFAYPGTVPAGAKTYNGQTSLAAFLTGLAAGQTGVLDYDGVRTENVSVTLKDGIVVVPAPGRRPWLKGDLHLSCGKLATIAGLSVRYDTAPSSDHVLDVKAGSIDFGYAEVAFANCYTLIHPTGTIHDWRFHHLWVHDNLGVSTHDGNQDHGFYCSAPVAAQNGQIDHCLIENMPRGRNIKIGAASGGTPIGGIVVHHNTLRLGHGPSNSQVSNGATNCSYHDNVLIDSGAATNLTDGSGSGTGSTYANNWSDEKTGPNTSHLKDTGGNVVKARAILMDYSANGQAGKGHLAP